jgi:succinylglutamate desuccinylase
MTRLASEHNSKYGNRRTEYNGRVYSSAAEARRAQELQLLQLAGEITDLREQVAFDLHACADANRGASPPAWYPVKVGRYIADFVYRSGNQVVVEDCKGVRTAGYMRSKRHMKGEYGIEIFETS